jgi:hypothetical protein
MARITTQKVKELIEKGETVLQLVLFIFVLK